MIQKTYSKILAGLFVAAYILPAAARVDWSATQPIIILSGGAAFTDDAGASDSFKISSTHFDYDTDKDTQTKGVWGGLLGVDIKLKKYFSWQTGLGYYQATPFSVSGNESQYFTPPTKDTFPYTYEIVSRQLLWENKLVGYWRKRIYPYVSVGIGAAFNETQKFNVHHTTKTFTPEYESERKNSFTYSLGFGAEYALHPHIRLGLGYRFTDLGKAGLGDGDWTTRLASAPAPDFSSQSHLYTQEILAQLTFLM